MFLDVIPYYLLLLLFVFVVLYFSYVPVLSLQLVRKLLYQDFILA